MRDKMTVFIDISSRAIEQADDGSVSDDETRTFAHHSIRAVEPADDGAIGDNSTISDQDSPALPDHRADHGTIADYGTVTDHDEHHSTDDYGGAERGSEKYDRASLSTGSTAGICLLRIWMGKPIRKWTGKSRMALPQLTGSGLRSGHARETEPEGSFIYAGICRSQRYLYEDDRDIPENTW